MGKKMRSFWFPNAKSSAESQPTCRRLVFIPEKRKTCSSIGRASGPLQFLPDWPYAGTKFFFLFITDLRRDGMATSIIMVLCGPVILPLFVKLTPPLASIVNAVARWYVSKDHRCRWQ